MDTAIALLERLSVVQLQRFGLLCSVRDGAAGLLQPDAVQEIQHAYRELAQPWQPPAP